ncbi:MAG: sigma factor-like helix-turn-helix DNA-binding protein [Candidatus Latescibacteria bacterium]|nr:sigma factor-like helix-turn-helix DNA-binding protein [Candidatus Latescibacterota bacterium]
MCDDEPQSLETIGRQMGLSRERIRQIKDRGLQQLRHHACSVRLQALL